MRTLGVWLMLLVLLAPVGAESETQSRALLWGGRTRSYRLHLPASGVKAGAALVLVLHGGGGNAHSAERQLGFSELADQEGFVVAYPNAVERNWNDGRNDPPGVQEYDDVGFLGALIDSLGAELPLDRQRVFLTGPSNGGMMCQRAGLQLSGKVAAIAPVLGGLAAPLASMFAPAYPVSVLMIQSLDDPWVPYGGGPVRILGGRERGAILPTEETAALWVKADGCQGPLVEPLRDEASDGCRATRTTWVGGRNGTEVSLIAVQGAGHTWPGGLAYLPEALIGRVCRDFQATPLIWQFFAGHPRQSP